MLLKLHTAVLYDMNDDEMDDSDDSARSGQLGAVRAEEVSGHHKAVLLVNIIL